MRCYSKAVETSPPVLAQQEIRTVTIQKVIKTFADEEIRAAAGEKML